MEFYYTKSQNYNLSIKMHETKKILVAESQHMLSTEQHTFWIKSEKYVSQITYNLYNLSSEFYLRFHPEVETSVLIV